MPGIEATRENKARGVIGHASDILDLLVDSRTAVTGVAVLIPDVYSQTRSVVNASIQLLRHVLRSVVQLKATVAQSHASTVILGARRMGTGTIVDRSGLVLTVNYVVIGASEVEVTLFDGSTVDGEVVAQDYTSGIALVRIPGSGHVPAPLRKSYDLQTGEEVFLIASVGDG